MSEILLNYPNTTVSVVIPTHNRPQLLARAVNSVLQQTFQDFELIIVDDASTPRVLAESFNDKRVRILRNEKSEGGSRSRNRGIFASSSKWIAFLDDDDAWQPDKLEQQLKMLARNTLAVACSTAYTVHYPLGYSRNVFTPAHVSLNKLLHSNCLGGASVCLCDAETIKQFKGLNPDLRSAQDWDLWVKLRLQGEIVSVPKPLVDYYVHFDARISNNMQGKYQGAKRFYFLYKPLMTKSIRREHLQFICYIKSRLPELRLWRRIQFLLLAIKRKTPRTKLLYLFSSLSRMVTNRQ